jgi:hypothetical protein
MFSVGLSYRPIMACITLCRSTAPHMSNRSYLEITVFLGVSCWWENTCWLQNQLF